jgi:hypothetical protein
MPIEKTVTKRTLESLRERENPWLKSTPQERLAAMAVICQARDDGKNKSDGNREKSKSSLASMA